MMNDALTTGTATGAANNGAVLLVQGAGVRSRRAGFDSRQLHSTEVDPMSTARVLPFVADVAVTAEPITHEAFVHAVRAIVAKRIADVAQRERILGAKLVYGGGPQGVRGVCYFGAWENGSQHDFLEIAALGEESFVQLVGTTVHELAHCLAGPLAGHGKAWKEAAAQLGLTVTSAAGQAYCPEHFDAPVWAAVEALPHPSDGTPTFRSGHGAAPRAPKPCPLGVGTRGGKSRGTGSGSRLRLWVCACPEGTPGRKVRVASDAWDATCNRCATPFTRG